MVVVHAEPLPVMVNTLLPKLSRLKFELEELTDPVVTGLFAVVKMPPLSVSVEHVRAPASVQVVEDVDAEPITIGVDVMDLPLDVIVNEPDAAKKLISPL